MTLHQNGNHPAKRIISWDPTTEELHEFTGKYYSTEIETMYTIDLKEESLIVSTYQFANKFELAPAEKDFWTVDFLLLNFLLKEMTRGIL